MIALFAFVLALAAPPAKPCALAPKDSAEKAAPASEPPVGVPGQPGECVDATLQEQLLAKRRHRLTKDRLFVKALRHELTVYGGRNAPYVWFRTPSGVSSWDFFDRLLATAGVVGAPGSGFGPSGEGYFRLTAFGSREQTEAAVERLRTRLA